MKLLLIWLSVTFIAVVIIYYAIGVVLPDIYVEKAFVIIVYPVTCCRNRHSIGT